MLGLYLATLSGAPFPVGPRKDDSKPFACLGRSCSCMTAEQCEKSCCCFTAQEKRALGFAPPPEPAIAGEWRRERAAAEADAAKDSCCTREGSASVQDAAPSDCCAKPAVSGTRPARVALGVVARRCDGSLATWMSVLVSLTPPPVLAVRVSEGTAEFALPRGVLGFGDLPPPPVPPPDPSMG